MFGTFALYILRLRCLAISDTYKNSFCFFLAQHNLSKTTLSTFQRFREIIPIFVRLQYKVLPALVFEGYVWYFGSLHPAFEISSDTEYSFPFFWKRGLRRNVCNHFDDFRTNLPKNIGPFHRKQNTNFPK